MYLCEATKDVSFCAHAVVAAYSMLVGEALQDMRFFDNRLATGATQVRFRGTCP